MKTPRVTVTPAAAEVIQKLQNQYGALMFHQSGGCCEGSQPMCFEQSDFKLGYSDVCLGEIENCPFWMSRDQFEYWKHTQLTIDVVPGRGSSFSLEIPLGLRFITQSRLFSEAEAQNLSDLKFMD
ncbi:MAG: DUF779 domain-containing protein [Flavobacteriaceae bacterium]